VRPETTSIASVVMISSSVGVSSSRKNSVPTDDTVGVGNGVGVRVGVGVGAGVAVAVGTGVGVGCSAVGVDVGIGFSVGVAVGSGDEHAARVPIIAIATRSLNQCRRSLPILTSLGWASADNYRVSTQESP